MSEEKKSKGLGATPLAAGDGVCALFGSGAAESATYVSRSGPLCHWGISFRESDQTRGRRLNLYGDSMQLLTTPVRDQNGE